MIITRKSRRRLLLIGVCALLLVAAGVTAYVVRKQRVRAQFLAWRDEGMRAAAAADNEKAVDLLGRYLRRFPDDGGALVEYARVRPLVKSPNRQHLRDTMLVLRHLLNLNPNLAEQRRCLLRLYDDYGYASEALAVADQMLKATPGDAEIVGIRTVALARMRKLPEALASAREWVRLAPAELDAHLLCLELIRASGLPKSETDACAASASKQIIDPASSELFQALLAGSTGSVKEAGDLLDRAAARSVADPKVRRRLLLAFDNLGLYEKGLAALKRQVAAFGDLDERKLLVRRLWEANDWAGVVEYAKPIAAAELAADATLRGMIGSAQQRTGDAAGAAAAATALAAASQDVTARVWAMLLDPSAKAPTDARASAELFEAALKEAPGDPYVRFFVAEAYNALGESELAITSYQRAAQGSRSWASPLLRLSEAYLSVGRLEQAFEAAAGGCQRSFGQSALTMAMVWNANVEGGRRTDDAELGNFIRELQAHLPKDARLLPERVSVMARGGKKAEAAKLISDALASTADRSTLPLRRLAAVSRVYGLGQENACYDAVEGKEGGTPSDALLRAISAFLAGERSGAGDRAVKQFDAARQRTGGKGDDLAWQLARARLLDVVRDDAAAATWVKLGDAHPDDARIQQAALSARTGRNDREFTDRTIDRLKALTGGRGVQWRVARARWLLDDKHANARSGEQASALLTEALSAAPDSIEARFHQARALNLMGNGAGAVEQMQVVVRLNPSLQAASLFLAQLLQSRGDFVKAREQLERVARNGQVEDGNRQWAATLLAQGGDPQEAIRMLEDATDPGSGGLLLLAELYRRKNDAKRTEEICAKLLQQPDVSSIAFVADYYGSVGRNDDALRVIAMVKGIPHGPGIEELLLAEHAARYGKPEDAVRYTRAATKEAPANAATWQSLIIALVATGRIGDAEGAVAEALIAIPGDRYAAAARAILPVLKRCGGNQGLHGLTEALIKDPEASGTRELIEAALVPETDKEPKARRLSQFRQIADRNPLNLAVQLFVAERYLANNFFAEAGMVATRAAQSFPLSVEATRLAANALAAADRWSEALAFAGEWRARNGGRSADADYLESLSLVKLKKPAEACKRLSGYFPAAAQDPDRNASLIALYGAALHLSDHQGEAEKLMLPALAKAERVRTAWLSLAIDNFPADQALAWAGRVLQLSEGSSSVGGQVELAGLSAALGKKAGDASVREVARKLRASLAARTELSAPVLAVLGSQAEWDEDFAGAIALYRRVLAADPTFSVINNNLAMLLLKTQGDLSEAQALARRSINGEPSRPNYYDTLAHVLEKQGGASNIDKAVENLHIAIRLDPDAPLWHANLVELLLNNGRRDELRKAFSELQAVASRAKLDDETKARVERLRQQVQALGIEKTASSSAP